MGTDGEAEPDELDARSEPARLAGPDEEAPEVREHEQPHEQGDRAHVPSSPFFSSPRARRQRSVLAALRPSPPEADPQRHEGVLHRAPERRVATMRRAVDPPVSARAVEVDELDAPARADAPCGLEERLLDLGLRRRRIDHDVDRGERRVSMHAGRVEEAEEVRDADVTRSGVLEANIEQADLVDSTGASSELDELALLQAPAVDQDRADRRRRQQRGRRERDRDERHQAHARQRAVALAGDERRREHERRHDDPEADERARGPSEIARQPRDLRVAARDAVEEETDETHEHAHREDGDTRNEEDRERAADARRERRQRREHQAGEALGVPTRRREQREPEDEPCVADGDLGEAVAERQRDRRASARGAGAHELDLAELDRREALRILRHPVAELLGDVGGASEKPERDQRGEDEKRDAEDRRSDRAALPLARDRLRQARRHLRGEHAEAGLAGRLDVLGPECEDRRLPDEDYGRPLRLLGRHFAELLAVSEETVERGLRGLGAIRPARDRRAEHGT